MIHMNVTSVANTSCSCQFQKVSLQEKFYHHYIFVQIHISSPKCLFGAFFLSMKHFYNYFISKMCPSWNRLNIQVPGLPQKCYSGLRNKEKTTIVVLGLFPSKVISIFMFVLLCCSSGSRKCSEELVSVSSGGANCRQSLVSTAFPFDHTVHTVSWNLVFIQGSCTT